MKRVQARVGLWFQHCVARALEKEPAREQLIRSMRRYGADRHQDYMSIRNRPSPYNSSCKSVHYRTDPTRANIQKATPSAALRSDAIFITGRFRCGSTALWNVFRQIPSCRAFYEPFNERRFFDPVARGADVDTTHRNIENYWSEYSGISGLGDLYKREWAFFDLLMGERAWSPDMLAFLKCLMGVEERPVLQFNRIDFRLAWLKRQFPNARIIHMHRHPREQWCSFLGPQSSFSHDSPISRFSDRFYLIPWARDLMHAFPFLTCDGSQHPYRLFYYLWKLSWLFGTTHAHYSVSYEKLTSDPEVELRSLFDSLEIYDADSASLAQLIGPAPALRSSMWAPASWFDSHEQMCEERITEFLEV